MFVFFFLFCSMSSRKRKLPTATFAPSKLTVEELQIAASRTEDGDVKDLTVVNKNSVKIGQKLVATFDVEFIDSVPNAKIYTDAMRKAQVDPAEVKLAVVKADTNGLKGFRVPFDDSIRTIEFMKKQCNTPFRQYMNEKGIDNIGIVPRIHKIDCGVITDKPPCLGNERNTTVQPAADIYVFDDDYKAKPPLRTYIPGLKGVAATGTTPTIDGTPVTLARHLWKPLYHKHISASQMGNGSIAGTLNEVVDTEKKLPVTLPQPYLDIAWSGVDESIGVGTTLLKIQIEYSYERMSQMSMYRLVLEGKASCPSKNLPTGIPSRLFAVSTLQGHNGSSRILVKTNGCNVIQIPQPNIKVDEAYWSTDEANPIYASEIDRQGDIKEGNITQLPEIKSTWKYTN